jgi:glycosyltransferase involved in cell wall biosynthesis
VKVLIVTGIYPPDIGGPATHASDLRAEFVRRGHDAVVLTLGDRDEATEEVVRLSRSASLPTRMARTSVWIASNARRFDAVYATGLQVEAVAGARAARAPVVVKVVGDLAWERGRRSGWSSAGFDAFDATRESWRVRAVARLQNATLRAADEITAPSEALARTIRGWLGGPARVEAIPNGVARPDVADRPDVATFVYVGRLIPHKRVDRLVEAAVSVPGARLEVLGDGSGRDVVMREISRSTALVLASDYEGLPHVVIEALACGVPVISPAVGGVPEVVTDGSSGLILADASVGTLRVAMERLATDDALERKLRVGARETGAEWTIERTADRVEALLERAILGRPRAVFFGGSAVAPATPDVIGRLEILSRTFRTAVIGTGAPGVRAIGTTRTIATPVNPRQVATAAHLGFGAVAAVALAARRRSAIVCQSPFEAIGVETLASLLPRSMRPGIVVEVHGDWRTAATLYGAGRRASVARLADRLATRAIVRADRVRAVGTYTASLAREAGYGGIVDRFPAFADYGAFAVGDGTPSEPRSVAFVGALERVKGIDVLLDAWALVAAQHPGAVLRIAGIGTLAGEVTSRAAALDGVAILGALRPDEVRALLDRSGVVVVPSRSEGLGRVILEAFARGRPVVASAVGGIPELVDETTGILVPPGDPGALAEGIGALLEDPSHAAAMGDAGRARFSALEPARAFEDGIERLARWIDAR